MKFREFIAKRDNIIKAVRLLDWTHVTITDAWHGQGIPEGTKLVTHHALDKIFTPSNQPARVGSHWYLVSGGTDIALLYDAEVRPRWRGLNQDQGAGTPSQKIQTPPGE